jgi:hypothetical protein
MKKSDLATWTQTQADLAVSRFLELTESKFVLEKIRNSTVVLQEQFESDAKRRWKKASIESSDWAKKIFEGCPGLPEKLAVCEPFAQKGIGLDDLFMALPRKFTDDCLVIAWRRVENPNADTRLQDGITDTKDWDLPRLKSHLEKVKVECDWENTIGSARKWWEAFETENLNSMRLVVRVAEEIAVRSATITEFFLAYIYSNTNNLQANIYYLDYTRLKKAEIDRKKLVKNQDESQIRSDEIAKKTDEIFRTSYKAGITDSVGWSKEEIHEELSKVEKRIQLESTTGSALKWWNTFCSEYTNEPSVILRLAEEISIRFATVTEFFLAKVYSNTDDLQANLYYLDYSRLKQEEANKKKEAAANAIGKLDQSANKSKKDNLDSDP